MMVEPWGAHSSPSDLGFTRHMNLQQQQEQFTQNIRSLSEETFSLREPLLIHIYPHVL